MDPLVELGRLIAKSREATDYVDNQKGFAATLGIHQSHLSKLESGAAAPSTKVLRKLADKHGADYSEMFRLLKKAKGWAEGETEQGSAAPTKKEVAEKRKGKLPVLGQAKCGPWMIASEHWADITDVADDWEDADPKLTRGKRGFWVRVEGDSMNKEGIMPGDLLLIVLEPHESGKPALVRLGDDVTVKFVEFDDDHVDLVPSSTNPENTKQRISRKKWEIQGGVTCRVVGYKAFRRF